MSDDRDAAPIWERQADEPGRWHDRFERYRLAGPARSMLAVYNAERAGKPPAKTVPETWRDAAAAWDWHARCAAWDAAAQQRRREQYDADREADHEARVTLLKLARNKLFQAIGRLDASSMKAGDVLQGIRIVVQELRAEYDDLPTQPIDVTSLSDEELYAIATGARRR